jgi:hypothetical protein
MNKYVKQELTQYWPVSKEQMALYKDGTNTDINHYGAIIWEKNGKRHRDGDLPAEIWPDGSLFWKKNGWLHRDGDRPARIEPGGNLSWYQNGELHRTSGPARIWKNGKLEWWIRDKNITLEVHTWLADTKWRGTLEQIAEFQMRFC